MSTPQDAPNRKKQKIRAARKLAVWKKKQAANKGAAPVSTTK
ncbi:MAG: hypothetical protein RL701_5977 [Pseudomonadota bacterium]|jgi:hypothetical protein